MVPPSILSNLASLRRRERLLTLVWGAACWLAVALTLLFLCALGDWLIDRERETPMGIRLAFFALQAGVWLLGGIVFVIVPQIRRLPDDLLALWVEAKYPKFDHRIISAVQFNREDADLAGMSKELVAIVTREAEKEANRVSFAGIADHRRLGWSLFVTVPVMLLVAAPFVLWPGLAYALLQRQALMPTEVPHSVQLVSASVPVWTVGDTIPIRYRVSGKWSKDMVGSISVTPIGHYAGDDPRAPRAFGSRTDRYKLEFIKQDGADAIFGADVPGGYVDVRYAARLADGRTKAPSLMTLVARPVVARNEAWVLLPEFCGLRPDGGRYEIVQPRGDVIGIPGSKVRIQFEVPGPNHEAWLELRGPEKLQEKRGDEEVSFIEVAKGDPIRMDIKPALRDGGVDETGVKVWIPVHVAEKTFDLVEGLSGYRMIVEEKHEFVDEQGKKTTYSFDNDPKPRRALRLVPEDAPTIMLLRDTFSEGGTFDVEGMPVPLYKKDEKKRSQIRIPYVCFGAYGLGKAQVLYRVVPEHVSGKDPVDEEPWVRAPLPEMQPDKTAGAFDLKTGIFENTPDKTPVPFHAVLSEDPRQLGRTRGGGRVHLDINGLIDSKGNLRQLKSGDKVEYCIEVYSQYREPAGSTPFARSETRITTVLDVDAFRLWLKGLGEEDQRVKDLYNKEKGLFDRK